MKRFFTRLTFIALISAFIVPMINTLAIWPLYTVMSSDTITYPTWCSEVMHLIYTVIDSLTPYAAAFCLAYSFKLKKERLKTSLTVGVSLIAVSFAALLVDVLFYTARILTGKLILFSTVSTLLDALILAAAACFAVLLIRRPEPESLFGLCSVSSVVILLSGLLPEIYKTVMIFYETSLYDKNWAPQNISEWSTIIMPYINIIICFILGYLICRAILSLLEKKTCPAQE